MNKNVSTLCALAALLAACSASAQSAGAIAQEPIAVSTLERSPASGERASTAGEVEEAGATHANVGVSCVVRARRTENGLLVQGRAFAERDFDGAYDLVVSTVGGANSSAINQSGAVFIAAGSSALLSENEMSFERGAGIRAVLTLHDAHGEVCRRTFTL